MPSRATAKTKSDTASNPAQPRHRVGVHEHAAAEGVAPPRALDREAELLVESHRRLVVDIDRELQPSQVEPIVCDIDERPEQGRADPTSMEVVVHGKHDLGGMAAASLM